MAAVRGEGGWGRGRGQRGEMVVEGDLTLSNGHTRQCADDALVSVHLKPIWVY